MPDRIAITCAAVTTDPALAVKAAEVLGRACAGLVLDGLEVDVHMETENDDD